MALIWGNMVGRVGLEPTTYGLKVRYSAIELAPLAAKRSQLGGRVGNGLGAARHGFANSGATGGRGGWGAGFAALDRWVGWGRGVVAAVNGGWR